MNAKRRLMLSVIVVASLLLSVGVAQAAVSAGTGNPNPGVIPNEGNRYGTLSAQWWQWAYSFPAPAIPFGNTGGAVDVSAGQSGNVWFLAGANNGLASPRTAAVPTGISLFAPLVNFVNDWPCPDPDFKPGPGQTMEEFLREGADAAMDWYIPDTSALFAEIDGQALTDLGLYRATSDLFLFTADPAAAPIYDACLTGEPQPGVSTGYWLLLPPLTPGTHTLHFGVVNENVTQDITYVLTVTPGN